MDNDVNYCDKCGSLNIQIDISSGKVVCNDCQSTTLGKKINVEKIYDRLIDHELKQIQKIKALGGDIKINSNNKKHYEPDFEF
jgi:transcription initiation factor TFIIIB Brf1 subunit/transcription initiation factor TFIIB